MSRERLSDAQIEEALAGLKGWAREGDALVKRFRFGTYMDGIAFVNAVAGRAEAADHHPDLEVSWGRVVVRLTTHDAGGITSKDVALAREIEGLASTALPTAQEV